MFGFCQVRRENERKLRNLMKNFEGTTKQIENVLELTDVFNLLRDEDAENQEKYFLPGSSESKTSSKRSSKSRWAEEASPTIASTI